MSYLKFLWDTSKANINYGKHGVSFDEAKSVFYDDHARLISDPDSSIGEERYIILGLSSNRNILIVCHCYRSRGEIIRIISARKANRRERKKYEEFRYA